MKRHDAYEVTLTADEQIVYEEFQLLLDMGHTIADALAFVRHAHEGQPTDERFFVWLVA